MKWQKYHEILIASDNQISKKCEFHDAIVGIRYNEDNETD